ncbi:MAG TPA: ISAs1 family transposase [Ktedonobacteraceae bacterium]
MKLTVFEELEQVDPEAVSIDAASLYRAFEHVKDGRKAKGKRYPLALLFTLILLGKLAGETKLDGIIDWINERQHELKKLLNWPKRFPVAKTYTDALARCDHHEVARTIAQVLVKARAQERCDAEPSRLLAQHESTNEELRQTAVDGKLLRGTLKHGREDQPPVHLLSFYECESGIVLDQFVVSSKNNEESACQAILHPVLVKGRILTVDAIFSCRAWCATVHAYQGYYMIPIKDNNPAVRRDLEEFFEDDGIDRHEFQIHKQTSKGHGRLEVREIWTSTQMNDWFHNEWAGMAQVFRICRTVKEKGEERRELVYGITNVPRKKADARRLLELNRKHWWIENRLHYRRDVTLGEDASQVRSVGAPEVLAALNGGLLALLDFQGVKNVAKHMRHLCAQPREALQLLLGKLTRHYG